MRFQKTIKRMIALGTGAIMLGSSVMAAADLANYPAPFVKDGKFSGVLVVGDKAAAEDVIGISDIVSSLQFAAVKPAEGGASTTVEAAGDAWKVGTSTKILEMTENLDTGTNREAIATITSSNFIDDAELPGLLAKGSVSNNKGTAEYDQRMYFEDTSTGYIFYTENNDDVTADFLYFANGQQIARYELEFTTQLESDVEDSTGSASTTGTYLGDLEDVELTMLGKKFQIVTARRGATTGDGAVLTLMGGAVRDTLVEGKTKTYTVDGKDYEVSLNYVDSDEAQFIVNGQNTRKLKDGDTDKLADGTTMGVSEILYQDYAGGIHSATFFLGAQKVELRDTDIELAGGDSHDLKVDDETIDNAHVIIEGSDDNTTFKLDKIIVNITADDDFYVPADGKLSEAMKAEGAEPEALFTKNWDIEYKGLSKVTTHQIAVKPSGSDDYNLYFTDGRGNKVSIPLAHTPSGSLLRMGDNDDDLVLNEANIIVKDDYFIITDETDTDGERQTFGLRYRGADRSTKDNPILKFDDLGSGERLERPVSVGTSANGTASVLGGIAAISKVGEVKLGGNTFNVYNASSHLSDDFNIHIDLDASGALDTSAVAINTKQGARIDVTNGTANVTVNITTPNADDFDDLTPSQVVYDITAASAEVTMSANVNDLHNLQSPQDDDDNSYGYTSQGAFIKFNAPTNDPQELTVEYPETQRVPLVYVTGKDVSFTETTAETSGSTAVTVQRIEVGAAKLASEVADVMNVNAILVGGPCANAAAATVMGNPADCAAGFEPGVGKIQLWEHANGNVAMLVAGYSALDTRNAAQVVANYKDYKNQLKGTMVEVKKVNNQLTVAAPAPAAAMPAAESTVPETEVV